ncbi:hypothetical protein NM208_g6147 [Fusarium decemcellulare]|uniref:Uncharacterized protein n=1 Tax=Fusarium decemcellulare TaxID=57161 RepID=A0ACC1SEC4_9HYPO|nr:hypothetical protein NM208_g6147 [Fusarium decemcellulare]
MESTTMAHPRLPLDLFQEVIPKAAFAIFILGALLFGAAWLTLKHDEQEPPLLLPRIPFVGHLIGMIRHQSTFLTVLSHRRMTIATVPVLNGKIYAIFDGGLIQAAQTNKDLSFVPFVEEFARGELGYDAATEKLILDNHVAAKVFPANRTGTAPHHIHRMNANALAYVAQTLNAIGSDNELVVPNIYLWVRDLMTMATSEALYGPQNPIAKDPSLIDDLWLFERHLPLFLFNVFPYLTARNAYRARERLQTALSKYYGNLDDGHQDAAAITHHRAQICRENGLQSAIVGVLEVSFLHVATSNTIPTLFWFLSFIITRPQLVSKLRDEAMAAVEYGPEEVIVGIHVLADQCPLLVSCYREAIRMSNKTQSNRRVMADTTITDGKGRTYLLKKGIDIQMPSDPLHGAEEVWGPDAAVFNPSRFLDDKSHNKEAAKKRRTSYIPFGGGKHLCPGRNFAFAENLGFMVSFLLGYDVEPIDGNWAAFTPPKMEKCSLAAAVCKPRNDGDGFGMRVKRRAGWEATTWRFVDSSMA